MGTNAANRRQRFHRESCASPSAPISQTNRTCGKRCFSKATVLTVKRCPRRDSISVATIRRPSAIRSADARRTLNGAIPLPDLSGFPGETMSHT